jgi:SAM-dependent methyltransferase
VTATWRDYFDTLPHRSPLHRYQAAFYVERLAAAIDLRRQDRLLDFGSGFGFATALLARRVAEVWWWEPSGNMRSVAERNLAECRNARFCDLSQDQQVPGREQSEGRSHSFDTILVNSVVQYMTPEQLADWLRRWAGLLSSGGQLVLSDLIPGGHSTTSDIVDLIRFGIRKRCPLTAGSDALGGVAHYWRTARAVPLTPVSQDDLAAQAAAVGLQMQRLPANLTHLRARWAAVLYSRRHICG